MDSPAASNNEFTHETLPDPAKYMRLLEVLDDNYSKATKVRCRLTTWPVESMPPYHAVSYTWGDPKSNTFILMNDRTLEVRTNCEFALKQVYWYRKSQSFLYRERQAHLYRETRSEWYTKSRYFWVDALCIDQSNDEEKSKQVAMMGSIYKNASHVLSCIGDHADDSLFFFESLYGLAHYVVRPKDVLRYNRYDGVGISVRFRLLHRHSSIHRFALALARLAVRPYFTRIWILQELQLAQQLTILCGRHVLTKKDALYLFGGLLVDLKRLAEDKETQSSIVLTPHIRFLGHKFLRRHVNNGFPHPVWHGSWLQGLSRPCTTTFAMMKQNFASVKKNLFQMLTEVVSRLQCQDPRDKAYGIISLIDWGDVEPLEPDYTQSDLEVAVKFVEAIMKLGKAQKLSEPNIWKFAVLVVKLFNLNIESRGLPEALEARRRSIDACRMEDHSTEAMDQDSEIQAAIKALQGPKIEVKAFGWCLSPEDIDRNSAKLRDLQATPPQYDENDALYLPPWAEADDWVIELGTQTSHDLWYDPSDTHFQLEPTYIPLLVVGKGVEGRRRGCIGYGFYSPLKKFHDPGFKQDNRAEVYVFFDIEDSIVFLWKMKQLYEMHLESKDWIVDFLNMDVCRQQTAGPTYIALPSEHPGRNRRVEPVFHDVRSSQSRTALRALARRRFVLFDTKTRRGWLVKGDLVALQLLCAYLKNIPQTEQFDLSRLNHISEKSSKRAFKVLADEENLKTPILRVLKDVGETQSDCGPFKGQVKVEEKLIVEVLNDIYVILRGMDPLRRFPGDMDRFTLLQVSMKKRRNIAARGWDFERIYRNKTAKVYTHLFRKDPGWLGFARDVEASLIFGCGFGDVIRPRDDDCCPYFRILPEGQDYLAIGMDRIQAFVDEWTQEDEKDCIVARISHFYAWRRDVEPFAHMHGDGEHLQRVDCSCFPVQRLVKVPHFDSPEKDMAILKKRRRQLYSSQEIEEMNEAIDADTKRPADHGKFEFRTNGKARKTGMVVFGNRPSPSTLRRLAQASRPEPQCSGIPEERRNSDCSEISLASLAVDSCRLMRAGDGRWERWTGKEYPTYIGVQLPDLD